MPDLKQALKDFVATSNSGKYPDEATLLSKFPELKGYDINVLKDFVATSNSGKYKTEDELFAKFPEFGVSGQESPLKKKEEPIPPMAPQQEQTPSAIPGAKPYTESPLEDTSSELPSSGTDNSFFKKPYAPPVTSDISNIGIPKFEQKKVFGETKLKEQEIPTKIKGSIESVTPELINSNEEYVVPQMNYQFGDLGFKFEESGATGDWMKATAPNGKSIEISLDPFMSSKAVDESKRLKNFIKQNTAQLSGLDLIEKQYQNENKKFLNQKEIDDEIKKINLSEENLNLEIKSFIAEKNNVDKELKDLENTPQSQKSTQEYLDKLTSATQRKLDIQSKQISISEKVDRLPKSKEELNKAVGKYADMKSEQGTWLGGTLNFLLEGASSISAGAANSFIDLTLGFLPTDMLMTPEQQKSESLRISKELKIKQPTEGQSYEKWLNSLSQSEKDEIDSKIIDLSKKQVKADILPTIREGNRVVLGDSKTTVEWTRLKEQGFWGGAYAGLIKSLPAILPSIAGGLGGRALTTASFYSQISDGLEQEMSSNPNFKDISENEKAAIILPIGIAGAVLEEFGFRNAIGSKGLLNNLVLKALGKSGATTTATTFKELVQNEVESMIAKGVLTLTAAGLAEAETGAAQQIAEYGIKDIYNAAKGTKMFNNPETFTAEWVKEVVKAGAQEAVGGFIMGMPTAISSAYTKKGFLAMDDATFKIFEAAANDENIQKAFVTKLKNEYNNGDITIEQAKETLNNYRNSVGLFKSIPEGLDTEAKKESMNLLKEKRDLENQIIGKDDALVKPQKNRINEINESLTKISEDAIQKQATNESVLLSEQSKMGLQEMGEGNVQPEVTTTGTEEAITPEISTEEVIFKETPFDNNLYQDKKKVVLNNQEFEFNRLNTKGEENVFTVEKDGEEIGRATLSNDGNYLENIRINEDYRRQGIATNMYNYIEQQANVKLNPSPVKQSKAVEGLWEKRMGLKPVAKEASLKIEPIISETELPGYDRMIQEVDGIVKKSKDRGVTNEKVKENVMDYVAKSSVYEKATDVQREKVFREVNRMFGLKEVAAPSAAKILGNIKDVAKITMTEKQGLVKQIKDLARGGKDAKKAIYSAAQQLSKEIKELRKQGKLNTNQAANVVRKFSKVNVLSKISIDRFTDYMTKVFENADYISKLSTAKKLKQNISELSRNKDKNADLRELGRQFSEIDPSMVDDIEKYNGIAAQIKESIKGSTARKGEVKFAEIINIKDASNYIKETIDAQDKKIREERIDEIQDLMGIDASKFSAEDMLDLLKGDKKVEVNNEKSIKETAKNAFKIYSSIIKNTISTGVDAFTGEKVDFTKKQKELVNNFADMDLDLLDAKESVAAVDALTNFLQNHSTAKMEGVFADYTGRLNIKTLVKQGKVGIALRKLWNKRLARIFTEGGTPLPEVFTKIFKGVREGLYIATKSGFNKIVNGNAFANTRVQNITKEYIDKLFKAKPNGEKFNTAYNDAERGIASDLMRSVIGTESEMQKEFDRRKSILNQSIEELSTGTDEQQQKGKIYQKVYDNIVKGSKNINDIEKKLDKTNLEAIYFWMKTYDDIFPEIYDYMLNVRNTVLEKNLNYSSPDRYVKLSKEKNKLLTDDQPMYGRDGELLIKKEAGGLMKAERPDELPKGMYRDYSFDKNNVNSLRDVLVDMNTGAAIRQLDAFKNSKYFDKLIPNAEDRDLLKRRFALYVSNIRNAEYNGSEDLEGMMKFLDRLATLGVGMALGSPTQAIKQTIPIGINTMVNASGMLKLGAAFNPDFNNFFYNTGYASANRGIESQAEISSLNKKIETASNKVELLKAIENANKWWLKTFLVKPDVFIARASWQTYYEQELRKQGIDTKNLDYSKHKLNEQAGDYAETMVSRQQNTPDSALSGSWFSKSGSDRKILAKLFLNMANFRMNQSSRLAADLSVLGHWGVSTTEDKAIAARSIAGYAVEQAIYRLISTGLAIGIGSIVLGMRGDDESEEDKKKRIDAIIKGQLTGSVMDILSPAPFLDVPVKEILSPTLEGIEKATGLPLSIYGNKKQDYSNLLGAYGIPIQRAEELYDAIKLGTTGTYTDEFGKEKQITEEDQKIISELIPLSVGTVLGVMPSDVATGVRDIIKFSKRKQTTDEEVEQKIENAEKKQEDVDQKIEVLDKLKQKAKNQYEQEAIDEKIYELEADKEEKKVIKEANAEEKELKKELLTNPVTGEEYDNETALKKYNPRLYNKNFGVRSQWYKDHKYEKLVEKKMNAEIIKMEDEEHNYQKPKKTSSKKRNSDGSFKRSYYRKYSSESSN